MEYQWYVYKNILGPVEVVNSILENESMQKYTHVQNDEIYQPFS